MRNHYRTISAKKSNNNEDDEGKEISLTAFSGICFHCKKKGHRIKDCPEKKKSGNGNSNNNSSSNKFTGKCNNCGKEGHKSADCWEKDENASKRPKNWKNKEVTAAGVSSGNSKVEYLFCGLTNEKIVKVEAPDGFPDSVELLNHPDIWIADSGTTVHNTRHKTGVTNIRKETNDIVMGNGQEVVTTEVGDIQAVVCDKQGNQGIDVKLTDVAINPDGPFNLLSTSRLQQKGWILGGNDKALWLTKDGAMVKFDIVITTAKGLIFLCLPKA